MKEIITVRGDLKITIRDLDGNIVESREQKNLVMRIGKSVLAHLLANDAAYTNSQINRISFGTSNAAAADTQANLQGTIVTPAAPITVSYPAYNSVTFTTALGGSEGGVSTYQEIGLFTGDNRMFSRAVIAPITKSPVYNISVDWTLSFQ